MPVAVLELALIVTVLLVVVTQMLWPALRGTPFFPILRRRQEHALNLELDDVRQEQVVERLHREVARERARLKETDRNVH